MELAAYVPTDFKHWLLLAVLVSAAIYIVAAAIGWHFNMRELFGSIFAGALVPTGIDLIICAYHPEHLVELRATSGALLTTPVIVEIDGIHILDLAASGIGIFCCGICLLLIELRHALADLHRLRIHPSAAGGSLASSGHDSTNQ